MMTDWPEDFTEKVSALMETLKEGITLGGDAAMEAGRTILAAMWAILPFVQTEKAAITWARSARPNWYAIYYRTKKKRTRKKYLDRIIKEYRRNLEYGILEV